MEREINRERREREIINSSLSNQHWMLSVLNRKPINHQWRDSLNISIPYQPHTIPGNHIPGWWNISNANFLQLKIPRKIIVWFASCLKQTKIMRLARLRIVAIRAGSSKYFFFFPFLKEYNVVYLQTLDICIHKTHDTGIFVYHLTYLDIISQIWHMKKTPFLTGFHWQN